MHHSFWHRTSRTAHEQILYRLNSAADQCLHDLAIPETDSNNLSQVVRLLPSFEPRYYLRAAIPGIKHRTGAARRHSGRQQYPLLLVCPGLGLAERIRSTLPNAPAGRAEETAQRLPGAAAYLRFARDARSPGRIRICRSGRSTLCHSLKSKTQAVYSWETGPGSWQGARPPLPQVALDAQPFNFTPPARGHPKAVIYCHDHCVGLLKNWPALYPWRERNRWGAYLSYLQ